MSAIHYVKIFRSNYAGQNYTELQFMFVIFNLFPFLKLFSVTTIHYIFMHWI